jgi:hypothetical protein
MTPEQAEIAGNALLAVAASIRSQRFSESRDLTVRFETTPSAHYVANFEGSAQLALPLKGAVRVASTFSAPWPPADNGRFRVALYKGTFATSPVVYRQDTFSDHRTLKAACRRLAHIIYRQGRSGYKGERYDAAYIVMPDGERLPLNAARKLLAGS